jgi:putative toxin-antitoxin system antitoxin component (TIGR02293 family)
MGAAFELARTATCPNFYRQIAGTPMGLAMPILEGIITRLGGRSALDEEIRSEADLARAIERRLPLRMLTAIERAGTLTRKEVHELVIPERTVRHRASKNEPLSVEESDRLVRLARIEAIAEQTFEDPVKAATWLRRPLAELERRSPLEMASTEAGARVVETILAKIAWGAAA